MKKKEKVFLLFFLFLLAMSELGSELADLTAFTQPNQPNNRAFPVTKKSEKSQGRAFSSSWFKYRWLHYDEALDAAFCFSCSKAHSLNMSRSKSPFVIGGVRDWGKAAEKIHKHDESKDHADITSQLHSFLTQPSVVAQLSSQVSKDQEKAVKCLEVIIQSLMYLAAQGLAIRGQESEGGNFKKLLQLRAQDCVEMPSWLARDRNWTSPQIQNEIINIAAQLLKKKFVEKIRAAKYFSLMADESTDLACREQVSVCARVSFKLEVEEFFLGFHDTASTTGDSIATILLDAIKDLGLDIHNCRGQTYDGAANMSGHVKGVQARILEVEPRAVYTHCSNHVLNLALQDGTESSKFSREHLRLPMKLESCSMNQQRESTSWKRWQQSTRQKCSLSSRCAKPVGQFVTTPSTTSSASTAF